MCKLCFTYEAFDKKWIVYMGKVYYTNNEAVHMNESSD